MAVLGPINPAQPLREKELVVAVERLESSSRDLQSMNIRAIPLETCDGEVKLAGDRREWQAVLEICRQASAYLTGTSANAIRQMVASQLPSRVDSFIQMQEGMIEHFRQMAAWVAFMLGEDDGMEIQRNLVPIGETNYAPAPSGDLELG